MSEAAIRIDAVSKIYAGGKQALDNVSFDVPRGQIFGLLGPNGAGKSTLINILAGLVNKTSGHASIWGFDIDADPRNAKYSIGIVPQEIVFDPFFTPFETLENQAGLYGVPKDKRISDELLAAVHLSDKRDAYARTLSGGMKRRLLVAKAMVHSPPIIVLDEPTAGVDIELRQQLWEYVQSLNDRGVTVVLTTHYLEEAEELCDRIAIINHGKLIANKPTRELVDMAREKIVVVTLDADVSVLPSHAAFDKVEREGERGLAISYNKDRTNAGEVLAAVNAMGHGIVDVSTREADLEDVFLNLTRAANGLRAMIRRKFFGLSAATVSLLAVGRSAFAMGSSIVSDVLASAEWIAKALSSSGYQADFTLTSLGEIDRFFDEPAPGGVARPDGLLSEDVGSRIFAIGSYVGETIRRQLGGEWIGDDKDPQAEINVSIKLADGSIIWPIQRAMKRFRNGPDDSIAAYGAALSRPSQ